MIYHLAKKDAWDQARRTGLYTGGEVDRSDGFLHFSTDTQIRESARKHRKGETDLVLLGVVTERLGGALVWERSRGGALFPHLYGAVPIDVVGLAVALPVDEDGEHVFPELEASNGPA